MPRNDGRIEQGQRLNGAISARAWNRALDAADAVLGNKYSATAGAQFYGSAPYTTLYAYNQSGTAVSRFGILQIDGMHIPPVAGSQPVSYGPSENLAQFESQPVLHCVAVGSPSGSRPYVGVDGEPAYWCVAIEPIANQAIGRVAVAGVVQAFVHVTNPWATHVRPVNGATYCVTSSFGQARIVWKDQASSGVVRCLLELGRSSLSPVKARYSGIWAINTTKTVTIELDGDDWETYSVTNTLFPAVPGMSVTSPGTGYGYCYIYSHDGCTAELNSFDLASLKNYAADTVLGRLSDGVQWISLTTDTAGKKLQA